MNEYVFIDNNNGHFVEYYNFNSDATVENIKKITEEMRQSNSYARMGSKIQHLAVKVLESGFAITEEDNPRNRRYIDRIPVECISGNY